MAPVKRKRKFKGLYSKDALEKALSAVDKGTKVNDAAKQFNIPKSTLHDKVKGKTPRDCRMGRKTYLTNDEELLIVQ